MDIPVMLTFLSELLELISYQGGLRKLGMLGFIGLPPQLRYFSHSLLETSLQPELFLPLKGHFE